MSKKTVKTKYIVLIAAFVLVFAISAAVILIHLIPVKEDYSGFKNSPDSSQESTVSELTENPMDFEALQKENREIIGWLNIPDTIIDYPIMQSGEDTDEDFYLNHDINRKSKSSGSLYIQKLNYSEFTDPNTIIYGHNMLNGTMFGTLKKFRNTDYFKEHDTMYVYLPEHILTYKIYSAFVYDDRHILNSFDFYNNKSYSEFLEETLDPDSSVKNVRKNITVDTDSKIITLSTCTSRDEERYLVVGVLTDNTATK